MFNDAVLTKLKLWTIRRWVVSLAILVGVTTAAIVVIQLFRDQSLFAAFKTSAPIAASLIALLSLIATSISLIANWRRQRRLTTLNAWSEWSDKSTPARRRLTDDVGMVALSEPVGQALAKDEAFADGSVDLTADEFRTRVIKELVNVLNGLERLAVGVEMGVFDLDTIHRIGGTIVVRQWQRGEAYVRAKRSLDDPLRRQEKAFLALETMVTELQRRQLDEDGQKLDQRRLANLRGRP